MTMKIFNWPMSLLAGTLLIAGCTPFKDEAPIWPYPVPPDTSSPPPSRPSPPNRGSWPAGPAPDSSQPPSTQPPTTMPDPAIPSPWPEPEPRLPKFPRNEHEGSGAAALALLERSEKEERDGRYDSARAALERALRIEPRNPFLWSRLAAIRLRHGDVQQAEQLARKSNSLSAGNPWVTSRNWVLIATALDQMGDQRGARDARRKAAEAERSKNNS